MRHKEQALMKELLSEITVGSSVAFGHRSLRPVEMYLERGVRLYGNDISEGMLAVAEEELEAPDRVVYTI